MPMKLCVFAFINLYPLILISGLCLNDIAIIKTPFRFLIGCLVEITGGVNHFRSLFAGKSYPVMEK